MKIYITDDEMCTTQKLNLARVQKWVYENGSEVVDSPDLADKILCMTCNGWSLLEQKSYDRINNLSKDYNDKMIVMGCVVDSHPGKLADIWSGPTVRTSGNNTYSFAEIENFFQILQLHLKTFLPNQSFGVKKIIAIIIYLNALLISPRAVHSTAHSVPISQG